MKINDVSKKVIAMITLLCLSVGSISSKGTREDVKVIMIEEPKSFQELSESLDSLKFYAKEISKFKNKNYESNN